MPNVRRTDAKRFDKGVQLNPFTLTILEQIPGYIEWYRPSRSPPPPPPPPMTITMTMVT
jgi:hypothetical protein